MSFLSFLQQLLKNDMPMQTFIENHSPKSVYEVEQLQKRYEQIVQPNQNYI